MYQSLFFYKLAGLTCNFIKKETLAQVFSCEFYEISKNPYSYKTPPAAASGHWRIVFVLEMFFEHLPRNL